MAKMLFDERSFFHEELNERNMLPSKVLEQTASASKVSKHLVSQFSSLDDENIFQSTVL